MEPPPRPLLHSTSSDAAAIACTRARAPMDLPTSDSHAQQPRPQPRIDEQSLCPTVPARLRQRPCASRRLAAKLSAPLPDHPMPSRGPVGIPSKAHDSPGLRAGLFPTLRAANSWRAPPATAAGRCHGCQIEIALPHQSAPAKLSPDMRGALMSSLTLSELLASQWLENAPFGP